ncbi:MAG: hypothetical protein ACKOA8_15025 [Deltaproteobacteria bacterium]
MKASRFIQRIFFTAALIFLSHCARKTGPRTSFPVLVDPSSTTSSTVSTCSANPVVTVQVSSPVVRAVPTTVRFTGSGLCGNEFKIISGLNNQVGSFISSGGVLEVADVFNYSGTYTRQYNFQLVTPGGATFGIVYSAGLGLTVNEPSTTTTTTAPVTTTNPPVTTTTTTMPVVNPPTCQIERVLDAAHPPTSNAQQLIWVRVNAFGSQIASTTLNGYSVTPGAVYAISTNNFPFYEMEARVSNQFGATTSCRLSVATSFCLHSRVGVVNPTSVTTEVTVVGAYSQIFIQDVLQPNPLPALPWVAYTEIFSASAVERVRTTTGRVYSSVGDTWSCPVTYTVPALTPPAPRSFMNMNEYLYAGDSLVPPGPNICNCRAVMQHDGNFVVYKGTRALWNTHTWNNPGAYFVFQNDGNLVVYNASGRAKWNAYTYNRGAWQLHMQADCNLVLYSYNFSTPVWQTYTHQNNCY